ncbi:unnamed protein product [Blepharisma stoltei]|uniref:Protein kinase domain-containing protein n=1 Tax=Blepharisma stoltei TaxID=1481888 RepID=A0AAU9INI1_9CILI|nr:unnamed protein product [Blepharisma stoltei]
MDSIFSEIDENASKSNKFWQKVKDISRTSNDIDQNSVFEGSLKLWNSDHEWLETFFSLTTTCIYYHENDCPVMFSSISWKTVTPFSEENGKETRFGFRISSRNYFQDFYTEDEEELEKWLIHLDGVSILSDFENDYSIIKEIGKGNYGTVFLAIENSTGDEFAVKSISKELIAKSKRGISAISNEINTMRKLNHPNIISLYKVYESATDIHMVFDYAADGNLREKIENNGPMSEDQAASFLENLLFAINYMHSQNIIHRDIKLENILFMSKEDPNDFKICDFGLACELEELSGSRCGTPGYIAPEILRKEKYDFKADIYSVGILLYHLLTGKSPFTGSSLGSKTVVLIQNRNNTINFKEQRLKSISKQGIDTIRKLTSNNPDNRPNAQEALEFPWISKSEQAPKKSSVSLFFKMSQKMKPLSQGVQSQPSQNKFANLFSRLKTLVT